MAKRIQRKRTKGWRMPENTVYVGRPTKWGNPFRIQGDMIYCFSKNRTILDPWIIYDERCPATIEMVLSLYNAWITRRIIRNFLPVVPTMDLKELEGKDLACFCSLDKPCHVDILLKLINKP